MHIDFLTELTWPWSNASLHWAYLMSGLVIAAQYLPLLRRAWGQPQATATAQSLQTWAVWTGCRMVAFVYGLFILHDLLFLRVVGLDLLGRCTMALLILRARWIVRLRVARLA